MIVLRLRAQFLYGKAGEPKHLPQPFSSLGGQKHILRLTQTFDSEKLPFIYKPPRHLKALLRLGKSLPSSLLHTDYAIRSD